MNQEPIVLRHSCDATRIPSGIPITLPEGARVRITQALGGRYTLLTEDGELVRLAAGDRDALGEEAVAPEAEEPGREGRFVLSEVWDALRTIYDPEIPVNIVDLGLVYRCEARELPDGGHRVEVDMTMTAPGCGMGDILKEEARQKLLALPGVSEAQVELVFSPPWDQSRMSETALLQLGWL